MKNKTGTPLISVIVPVYNLEKYLVRCIESIIGQTYKNLEIILIDDGSTDTSGQIIDEFKKKDNRIKVIHKENGGESSARNTGLRMATGEYIAFCDCDDWMDLDMYEALAWELNQENIDMVASGWYKETDSSSQEIRNALPVNSQVFGRDELLKYLYMRDSYRGFAYMWDKLYKREILKDKDGNWILFREDLRLGGDVLYLAEVALNVKRAKYVDRAFYHYYQRDKSGCHTKDVTKLREWLKAYELILQRFEEEQIDYKTKDYVKRFLAYHSSNATEIAAIQGQKEAQKEFQRFMEMYKQEYISLNTQYPERIKRYCDLLEI
ncbi:MAG: glycosyltransferase [Hungatella sp.]|nr:glycosyltransferase [Hungatella sp.]